MNFKVKEEAHKVKLKLYTTNCRIQFQHAGKKECKQYDHLKNQCPPKYFAQNIIFPFCKKAYEDLKENKEAFVSHLRDEINRLVKEGGKTKVTKPKVAPKNKSREKCAVG